MKNNVDNPSVKRQKQSLVAIIKHVIKDLDKTASIMKKIYNNLGNMTIGDVVDELQAISNNIKNSFNNRNKNKVDYYLAPINKILGEFQNQTNHLINTLKNHIKNKKQDKADKHKHIIMKTISNAVAVTDNTFKKICSLADLWLKESIPDLDKLKNNVSEAIKDISMELLKERHTSKATTPATSNITKPNILRTR